MPQIEWTAEWPNIPGWYWVYQELDMGFGTYCQPYLIEEPVHIPLYAKAFYGPIKAPDMPKEFVSDIYAVSRKN